MSQPPFQPPPASWAPPASAPAPAPSPTGVWSSPVAGQHGGQPAHPYAGPQPPTSRPGGSLPIWLAGSALVVALIALVIAPVALFLPFGVGAMGGMGGTDLGAGDGAVPGAVAGQQLSGDRIAYAVVDVLLQRGAEVEPGGVECETVLQLDDVSTAGCHGTVDGDDTWSGTAEFWSEQGDFTLYED